MSILIFIAACSAPPIQLKCQEIRARLAHESLSEDQRRFAEQELRDCEADLDSAHVRDSLAVENWDNRFTPREEL